MNGIIYIHRNKINGKCYVGQTTMAPIKRWGENGCGYNTQQKFYRAILKHGWDNFEHLILADIYKTQDDLNAAEISAIAKYDSYYNGYNSTLGGSTSLGYKHTEETKKKLRALRLGKKHTEDEKKRIGIGCSKALKGKKHTREHIKNQAEAQRGRKESIETRRKKSEASSGRRHTQAAKQKMSASKYKKILVKDVIDDTEKIYHSMTDCATEINAALSQCSEIKNKDKLLRKRYYIKDLGRKYEARN